MKVIRDRGYRLHSIKLSRESTSRWMGSSGEMSEEQKEHRSPTAGRSCVSLSLMCTPAPGQEQDLNHWPLGIQTNGMNSNFLSFQVKSSLYC